MKYLSIMGCPLLLAGIAVPQEGIMNELEIIVGTILFFIDVIQDKRRKK